MPDTIPDTIENRVTRDTILVAMEFDRNRRAFLDSLRVYLGTPGAPDDVKRMEVASSISAITQIATLSGCE